MARRTVALADAIAEILPLGAAARGALAGRARAHVTKFSVERMGADPSSPWTLLSGPGNRSAQFEHTLVITAGGPEVMTRP